VSVSIKKTGIVQASGEIGANIIPNTSNAERTYAYPSTGYSDRFSATTSIIPTASNYILSFWAKSTVAGDKVRAHYYSPNTTTRCETSQGTVTTASDGNIDFTLNTSWEFYWVKYTQSATTAVKHIIFPRMFSQERSEAAKGTGTVSVKGLKFEEGTVPTLWIPNKADTDYFSNICGFNEFDVTHASISQGYINTTDFIEV